MTETPDPEEGEPGEEVSPAEGDIEQPQQDAGNNSATFEVFGARYTGPIPPPQMLEDYNNVLPGLAERIVQMAETEQGHSHKMDRWQGVLRFTGQFAAFVIALAGLVIGGLLIDAGHDIVGLATLITGLAPVVGAFLYRQIKSANDTASP